MAGEQYPKRGTHFAHKAFRLMHKTCAATEMGRDAMLLVTVILHTEDAARYTGPVRFFNSQLQETLAFKKWDTFNKARQKAIDAGWLHYEGSNNRSVGLYWVTIPDGLEDIDDAPLEEPETTDRAYRKGYRDGLKAAQQGNVQPENIPESWVYSGGETGDVSGLNEGINEGYSGVEVGDKQGEPSIPNPIPIPDPIPKEDMSHRLPSRERYDALVERWNDLPGVRQCLKPDAKELLAGWRRVMSDPIARACFDDLDLLVRRIRGSPFLMANAQGFFRIAWLFGKKAHEWNVKKILDGCYLPGEMNARNWRGGGTARYRKEGADNEFARAADDYETVPFRIDAS